MLVIGIVVLVGMVILFIDIWYRYGGIYIVDIFILYIYLYCLWILYLWVFYNLV